MNRQRMLRISGLAVSMFALISAVMAVGWVGTETIVENTDDADFCTTCHTMKPFADAHARDVHGGNNAGGVVANCTDCHLPHDGALGHLFTKARTGMHDLMAQAVYPVHKPDWVGGLEERATYVFDSGCLDCHAALKSASSDEPAAMAAHKAYFGGDVGDGCVGCHKHVGHAELRETLAAFFDEVDPVDEETANTETAEVDRGSRERGEAAGGEDQAAVGSSDESASGATDTADGGDTADGVDTADGMTGASR